MPNRTQLPEGFSRVSQRLWVSGVPPTDLRRRGFQVLVLCAMEYQDLKADIPTLKIALDDSVHVSEKMIRDAIRISKQVSLHRDAGRRVLVTCAAGINRSAFVAALSMIARDGMSADSAIKVIRETRGATTPIAPLSNPRFVAELRRFEEPGARGPTLY